MTYEDLTTFTENDTSNSLSLLSSCTLRISTLARSDYNTYLYKDYNYAFGSNFKHNFESRVDNLSADGSQYIVYMVGNEIGDDTAQLDGEFLEIFFYRNVAAYRIYISNGISTSYYTCTSSVSYYFTTERDGFNISCCIWSNSARSGAPLSTLITTLTTKKPLRYLYVASNSDAASAAHGTGDTMNYDLFFSTPTIGFINFNSDYYHFSLKPDSISLNDEKNITSVHYYTYGDLVFDEGKNIENITINGVFQSSTTGTYTNMYIIDSTMEAGEKVTISGFDNSKIDTTWYIEDFSYNVEGGMPNTTNWSLTLEKAYDI